MLSRLSRLSRIGRRHVVTAAAVSTALALSWAAGVLPAGSAAAGSAPGGATSRSSSRIVAVGAENEYANVISQIGGRYVSVSAIMSNPNTDPHSFEASPSVAQLVSAAELVIQNGLGYDSFMNKIEAAAPNSRRKVIDVQTLLGLPDSTPNPHLWYGPKTMPAVAKAVARDLGALDPSEASYFEDNARSFDRSLEPWLAAIAKVRRDDPNAPVATTEPVGDDMLEAAGVDIKTPWTLQADIMNGVDPAPQDVTLEENLFAHHEVKVFLYNQQVTDSLTATFLSDAEQARVPVVGVYETMPTPGYDYQSWMLAEVYALLKALSSRQSTEKL